jgi:hypothetical protein
MPHDTIIVRERVSAWTKRNWFAGSAISAAALLLGLVYALDVLGWRCIDPRNVSWIIGDPATAYVGWGFFRMETHLSLPLGWASRIGYPFGTPVAYFDSIPPVATAFWLLKGVLPAQFQYFGLYFWLCAALQFYFGFRISLRVFNGDRLAGLIGAVFFLTAPAFTFRAFGHFALASHWVLLAAIDQFLSAASRPSSSLILRNGVLCFIAGAINPYIAALTLLISCGAYLRAPLLRGGGLWRMAAGMSVALVSVVSALLLFGFLHTTDVSQYAGGGYGTYSMNLLAPVDPGFAPSASSSSSVLLRSLPRMPGQYEGYNYLGLGILLLCITALAKSPRRLADIQVRVVLPALAVCGISLVLALSDRAMVGHAVIYQLHLPPLLLVPLTAFRASGRLFWPAYYLIFTGVLILSAWGFQDRRLHVVLVAALIIQVIDVSPLRAAIHAQWSNAQAPVAPSGPDWQPLGREQKHLVVLPAWQCSPEETPGAYGGFAIFGRLAIRQRMTLNSFYAGRYNGKELQYFCETLPAEIEQHGLQADSAYVFAASNAGWAASLDVGAHYCRIVGPYILCSRVPGRTGFDPAILQELPLLKSGEAVSFAGPSPVGALMAGRGWSGGEPWGRWMTGPASSLTFRVDPDLNADVQIDLNVVPFVRPSHPQQRVTVAANGLELARTSFGQAVPSLLKVLVPARLIGSDGVVRLDFYCADPASPASLGLSTDDRELTFGVTRLVVSISAH